MIKRVFSNLALLAALLFACTNYHDEEVRRMWRSGDSVIADTPSPFPDSIVGLTAIEFSPAWHDTLGDNSASNYWFRVTATAADSLGFKFLSGKHSLILADNAHSYPVHAPLDSFGVVLAAPGAPPQIVLGKRSVRDLMNIMRAFRRDVILRASRRAA